MLYTDAESDGVKPYFLLVFVLFLPQTVSGATVGDQITYIFTSDGGSTDFISIRGHIPITHPQQTFWAYLELTYGQSLQLTVDDEEFEYIPPLQLNSHNPPSISTYDSPYGLKNALLTITVVETQEYVQIMDNLGSTGFYWSPDQLETDYNTDSTDFFLVTDDELGYRISIDASTDLDQVYNRETGLLVSATMNTKNGNGDIEYSWTLSSNPATTERVRINFAFTFALLAIPVILIGKKTLPKAH